MPARADAAALVADFFRAARGDIPGRQVAEAGVLALEKVVALGLGDVGGSPHVAGARRHPDAPIVAQRLAHQGELGLMVAGDRDAGGVDLAEAGVGEQRAALEGAIGGGDVAPLGVGREVVDVAVAAGGEDHRVAQVHLHLAGDEVAHDDAASAPIDDDEVEHLAAGVHLDVAQRDLTRQAAVGAQEQLLAGLTAGVEGARDLGAAKGAVVEVAAVLAGEGDALGHALVDDVGADLGQAVHVGLARAKVATLDGVVEQAMDAIAIVLIILGRVDPSLGGNAVRAPGTVLKAEAVDLVAQIGQGGGGRGAGEAGADDQYFMFAFVAWVDHLHAAEITRPLLRKRSLRHVGFGC